MVNLLRKMFRRPLLFNDLHRTRPISSVFGLDRGTPIDRYYIERFLQSNAEVITGTVLEIADSTYTRRFGHDVGRAAALHPSPGHPDATMIGNLTELESLPENEFDCFICTQTFNFIYDFQAAIAGAYRLIKPGGVLLATVAGISQISRYDMDRWGDYWRFTTASFHETVSSVFADEVDVQAYGNVLAAVALLQGVAVEDLPEPRLLDDSDPDYQVVITVVARKR